MLRRPSLRARLLAATHYFNADETGGAGASADMFGDDGLPAETPAAPAAAGAIGDDGMPKADETKPGEPAKEKPAEYVDDPKKSAEENAAAKKTFDEDLALKSVPAGDYDFAKIYEEHGITADQVDAKLVETFQADAKAANMTQAQANAMARVQIKAQADYAVKIATVKADWLASSKSDPEIGQGNWTKSVADGRAFIKEFGDAELTKLFKDTGLGGHPAILRAFARAGRTLGEGKVDNGGGGATTQTKSAADVFYGG